MKSLTAALILGAIMLTAVNAGAESRPALLAIFAHPDDDVTIGPLLAHYAKSGADVYWIVLTSGQNGVTEHAKIPAGAQLGAVREEEARQAANAYGVKELFLLQEQDGSLSSMQHHDKIVARITEIAAKTKAQVWLTFGPDGITGHPDHRSVSNLATEVFQMWPKAGIQDYTPQKLYYVAYPASKFSRPVPPFPGLLASVRDEFITTIVPCQDGLLAAAKAEEAYKSQHTPEIMKGINNMMATVFEGRMYLRLAFFRIGERVESETDVFANVPSGMQVK